MLLQRNTLQGKNVLDLASGEGYGTAFLSKTARQVIGIELDPEVVEHASKTYRNENITFKVGSILKIPLEGNELFDIIVCFEAIEHVAEHSLLLSEVKRLLKRDGLFIISTPNKPVYSGDLSNKNIYHKKESGF